MSPALGKGMIFPMSSGRCLNTLKGMISPQVGEFKPHPLTILYLYNVIRNIEKNLRYPT